MWICATSYGPVMCKQPGHNLTVAWEHAITGSAAILAGSALNAIEISFDGRLSVGWKYGSNTRFSYTVNLTDPSRHRELKWQTTGHRNPIAIDIQMG